MLSVCIQHCSAIHPSEAYCRLAHSLSTRPMSSEHLANVHLIQIRSMLSRGDPTVPRSTRLEPYITWRVPTYHPQHHLQPITPRRRSSQPPSTRRVLGEAPAYHVGAGKASSSVQYLPPSQVTCADAVRMRHQPTASPLLHTRPTLTLPTMATWNPLVSLQNAIQTHRHYVSKIQRTQQKARPTPRRAQKGKMRLCGSASLHRGPTQAHPTRAWRTHPWTTVSKA